MPRRLFEKAWLTTHCIYNIIPIQPNTKRTLGAASLACAACGLPLIPLALGGTGLAAARACLGDGCGVSAILCAVPLVALAGTGLWLILRRRPQTCDGTDSGAPGCNTNAAN